MRGGYDFTLATTIAIERWSAEVVRAQPGAFIYRGADLRHAVERSLFFELVNRTDIQARFASIGRLDITVPAITFSRRMRYEAGNLLRLLRPHFISKRLRKNPVYLFLTIHPKFVTFLKPIADELGTHAAYLTVEDKVTEAYLERCGLPVVAVQQAFTPRLVATDANTHWVSLCRAFDQVCVMFDRVKPSVVVVPEGNAPIYEIAHRAGQQRGIETIYMQHGAPAYTNPGFRNWTFANAIVWGTQFIEPFAKYNPQQKFTPIGTPASFGLARRRYGEPIQAIGIFLQKAVGVIPKHEWGEMLTFIGWLARSFPDIDILVREHPTQPRLDADELASLGTYPNLHFVPAPQHSLDEVLSRCDIVVAAASTTLLEAIAVGAIPFIFGTAYPPDFPAIAREGAAAHASSFDEARQTIGALVGDTQLRVKLRDEGERLRPELFASVGAEAAARIAVFLRDIAARAA